MYVSNSQLAFNVQEWIKIFRKKIMSKWKYLQKKNYRKKYKNRNNFYNLQLDFMFKDALIMLSPLGCYDMHTVYHRLF